MRKKSFHLLFIVTLFFLSCQTEMKTGEWVSIFDGETLNGWKSTVENAESITVEDGAIKCAGARSHLFYEGEYKNFEFEAEIKTLEHSNSGIFIHSEYLAEGWPQKGYEIQVTTRSEVREETRNDGKQVAFTTFEMCIIRWQMITSGLKCVLK